MLAFRPVDEKNVLCWFVNTGFPMYNGVMASNAVGDLR